MNKARETRERHTDKFHNSMSSLGFEPPNPQTMEWQPLSLTTGHGGDLLLGFHEILHLCITSNM